jgi:hypothetical protein
MKTFLIHLFEPYREVIFFLLTRNSLANYYTARSQEVFKTLAHTRADPD